MQHFEAGWGWDAQLRQYVRKKYRQDLEGLRDLDPYLLARLMRGEILEEKPYATVKWVMCQQPFRPLELYWLFDHDAEHGADLRILFARKSLVVPTEDAYVFAWDFLALMSRYGRGSLPLADASVGPEWLSFSDFAPTAASPIQDTALGPREELLKLLSPDLVKVAMARLDVGACDAVDGGWQVTWPILGDLAMRLSQRSDGREVAFDSHGARKYAPEFLMSFAWLYINALLRECRQVDPSLPRLSRYF
ncbi:MAG: hypothetical protein P8X65_05010 [Syntrophobacterales bacterium]